MRIIVLGSGVVGVMTAYYLAADGHEVVVLDRQAKAGLETSHANAGLIAPGQSMPGPRPARPRFCCNLCGVAMPL
jgi:D-amino-acid dehydrogenase